MVRSSRVKQFFVVCFWVCFFGSVSGADLSVEAIARKLGSDDPAVRRQVGLDLDAAGDAADGILVQLMKNEDGWVAARASRIWFERLGIDPMLPFGIQRGLANFGAFSEKDRREFMLRLTQVGERYFEALIFLAENHPGDQAWPDELQAALRRVISSHGDELMEIEPTRFSVPGRATILSLFRPRHDEKRQALYEKWRRPDDKIRDGLPVTDLKLEAAYLKKSGQAGDWLNWIGSARESKRRHQMISLARGIDLFSIDPKELVTDTQSALGWLSVRGHRQISKATLAAYEAMLEQFPGLIDELFEELRILEVHRLEFAGDVAGALRLALEGWGSEQSLTSWLRELGRSLEGEPELIKGGFPVVEGENARSLMAVLLRAYFPMIRPRSGYSKIDEKVVNFDRWARSPEWLEVAWESDSFALYHLTMIRRGRWDELILRVEGAFSPEPLEILGALIALKPELGDGLPAMKCEPVFLQGILDGALQACPYSPVSTLVVADLVTGWSQGHPVLREFEGMKYGEVFKAIWMWRGGQRGDAIRELKDLAFTDAREAGVKEVAEVAKFVLFDLLGSGPELNYREILADERCSKEWLSLMFRRLAEAGTHPVGRMKASLAVTELLREKYGAEDLRLGFGSTPTKEMILKAWQEGGETGDELAGDFVISALVTGKDFEFRDDGRYVALLALLGRCEDALEILETAKAGIPASAFESKKGWLLRSLGRKKEALELMNSDSDPWLQLTLALEMSDWKSAAKAVISLKPERSRAVRRAMLAAISRDEGLMKSTSMDRHTGSKLALGMAESLAELEAMGRHTQIAVAREMEIGDALALGQPLPKLLLYRYLQYPDLLPNWKKSVDLLSEVLAVGPTGEGVAGMAQKLKAAGGLTALGRVDLAFEGLRPFLERGNFSDDAEEWVREAGIGDGRDLMQGLVVLMKLTEAEWPKMSQKKRLKNLGLIFAERKKGKRTDRLLKLVEKHEEGLDQSDLLPVLFLLIDGGGWKKGMPQALAERVLAICRSRQLNEYQMAKVKREVTGALWQSQTSHPPFTGKGKVVYTHTPKLGEQWDPRAPGFQIVDGIAKVEALAKSDRKGAVKRLKEVMIRVLLDRKLMSETEWRLVRRSGRGSWSSGFDTRGANTVLLAMEAFQISPQLAVVVADHLSTPRTGYADSDRDWRAGRFLAEAGRFREAAVYFQRFLITSVEAGRDGHTGYLSPVLVRFHRAKGLEAAFRADWESVVGNVQMILTLAPFRPWEAEDLMKMIREHAKVETREMVKDLVGRFWRARLFEMPESGTYLYWRNEWEKMIR